MPRALATTVAMFAASLLVLGSAVMLIMGSADKPAATPAPAALDGIEPRTGGARAPRIDVDVNPATQALQPRGDAKAAGAAAPAAPVREAPVAPPVPAALQTAPELPAARPGRPVAAPPPGTTEAAAETPRPARSSEPARPGGPISLLPRRAGDAPPPAPGPDAAATAPALPPAPAVAAPLRFPAPSYTAAVPPGQGLAPAPAAAPLVVPPADDESNMTADQLNERELERVRKRRAAEETGAAAQPARQPSSAMNPSASSLAPDASSRTW